MKPAEQLARALHAALVADSPTAHIDPIGSDDRLVIDGRFDLVNVARQLLKQAPLSRGETPPTPQS